MFAGRITSRWESGSSGRGSEWKVERVDQNPFLDTRLVLQGVCENYSLLHKRVCLHGAWPGNLFEGQIGAKIGIVGYGVNERRFHSGSI